MLGRLPFFLIMSLTCGHSFMLITLLVHYGAALVFSSPYTNAGIGISATTACKDSSTLMHLSTWGSADQMLSQHSDDLYLTSAWLICCMAHSSTAILCVMSCNTLWAMLTNPDHPWALLNFQHHSMTPSPSPNEFFFKRSQWIPK